MDYSKDQFIYSFMRFKKSMVNLSTECEMQMNELAILSTIVGNCSAKGEGTNLDVHDIQIKLQITKPAVSYILNTLEKKNYIKREIDPKDRRKLSITATKEGYEAEKAFAKTYDQAWNTIIARFGEDDMKTLITLLGRLNDICEEFSTDKFCNDKNKT
ncbi:DNA-binding MarR family transcriptional regulator [Lachnospiraceae bacterium PF1-21]